MSNKKMKHALPILLLFASVCQAANDPIEFQSETTGLTLSAKIFSEDGLVDTISMTESPSSSGRYVITAATLISETLPAGDYGVRIEDSSGTLYGFGPLKDWDGDEVATLLGLIGTPANGTLAADNAAIEEAVGDVTPTTESRDFQKVQHLFTLKRSATGALQSTPESTLYLSPGSAGVEDFRCGINLEIPAILPGNAVPSVMSTPTSDNGDFTLTKLGFGPDGKGGPMAAKFSLDIAADATDGSTWVTTTITNDLGGGPVPVYVKVVVEDAPTP